MRRYGLYDATRGLTTVAAAGAAGVLLWAATLVGQQTDKRFWAEMAIVAGAGLVIALSQAIGGWTKGLRVRVSPGTFVRWTHDIGLTGLVHDLALWHGALAFGFGLVLGLSFDAVPAAAPVVAPAAAAPAARHVSDEPLTAQRREVGTATGRPREVAVGPHRRRGRTRTPNRMD